LNFGLTHHLLGELESFSTVDGIHGDFDRIGTETVVTAEIVTIELGLLFAVHKSFSDVHFLIKLDNQGVIHAIEG
jgi:hypothetical protein